MTEEDFNLEALGYLLEELDTDRRAAFADQLDRDLVMRAKFKQCVDRFAEFAADAAPAEAMTPANQRVALAAILAAARTGGRGPVAVARRIAPWHRYVWPAAAAVLFGLNLVQFYRGWISTNSGANAAGRRGAEAASSSSQASSRTATKLLVRESAASTTAVSSAAETNPAEELRRLEKLRSDYANLQHASEALRSEYDSIIRQLAQRALVGQGVGRMAAMELVDADSYARGERKGLISLARGLLTAPGIIAVAPVTPPPAVQPSATVPPTPVPTPQLQTAVGGGVIAGTTLGNGAVGVTTVVPTTVAPGIDANSNPSTVAPTTPPTAAPDASVAQPYAWSVFDETEGQGYLNLYNLPVVPADQALQLWVRSADSADYRPVGDVPAQFYGGSGSLYYKLPDSTATPTDILITREPRNPAATKPTGPRILHGP